MNLESIIAELRAHYGRVERAIEELERIYRIPTVPKKSSVVVKRRGRPRKREPGPR